MIYLRILTSRPIVSYCIPNFFFGNRKYSEQIFGHGLFGILPLKMYLNIYITPAICSVNYISEFEITKEELHRILLKIDNDIKLHKAVKEIQL